MIRISKNPEGETVTEEDIENIVKSGKSAIKQVIGDSQMEKGKT